MNVRGVLLSLASVLLASVPALGSGGNIWHSCGGTLNYIYVLQLPVGTNDRAITRYGYPGQPFPNGSEFDPNTIICGARSRSGHQSNVSVNRPELCDVRLEDPNNPGYPSVLGLPVLGSGTIGPAGVGADSNAAPSQCTQFVGYQNFTFNGGRGCRDPLVAVFVTWKFPGENSNDPCWLGLDTTTPNNGRALYYNSTTQVYAPLGSNHCLDVVTFTPRSMTLNFQMHGAPQFPGDPGQKVWFIRADAAGTITDDFVSASIVVDNHTSHPIGPQHLSVIADLWVINPKLGLRDISTALRLLSNPGVSIASGNPYTWAAGRTRVEANIPAVVNAKYQSRLPLNMAFAAWTGPIANPTAFRSNDTLGLRPSRGVVDSGIASIGFLVQSPAQTNDALATRFPLRRLFPKTGVSSANPAGSGAPVAQIAVTRVDVVAATNGGRGGFDAVQVRRADPIVLNAADQSPLGLLGGTGLIGDGSVDVPVPPAPGGFVCQLLSVAPDGGPFAVTNSDDLWVMTYPAPGDTANAGSFVCADVQPATILEESFFDFAGTQPYTVTGSANWMQRLIFTASPFGGTGDSRDTDVDPRQEGPLIVRVGDRIPMIVLRP